MNEDKTTAQAAQFARDTALCFAIAALMHHHPRREDVLNSLRQVQVRIPGTTPENLPEPLRDVWRENMTTMIETIRELERTHPDN